MLAWDIHGTLDGWVVTYDGQPVAEWPDFKSATAGYHLARRALLLLDATLAKTPKEAR